MHINRGWFKTDSFSHDAAPLLLETQQNKIQANLTSVGVMLRKYFSHQALPLVWLRYKLR